MVLLADGLQRAGHSVLVAMLYPGGPLEVGLQRTGVPILSLEKRGRYDFAGVAVRLARAIRREKVEVVYSALTAANVLAVVARIFVPRIRVVWGLRASNMDLDQYDRWTRITSALEPWLSRFSDRIIVNSRAGLKHAAGRGFPHDKMTVVVNAVDTDRFHPPPEGRARLRAEWNIDDHESLVGLVGRIDPMKDHRTFLEAAALLKERSPHIRFVCVGSGAPAYVQTIRDLGSSLGLDRRLLWTGPRFDMAEVYGAIDVLVLCSSFGEGIPNVVAEAMACETPCVVTDVGDAAWLVGDGGSVVPPASPARLADAIENVVQHPPTSEQRQAMRRRIIENLGVDRLVRETEAVLRSAIEGR